MKGTFKERVYKLVADIPKGKVATYGQIAKLAGSPGAARAVGSCMKNNKDTKKVPCHRVVASNGHLTGYSMGQGVSTKKTILKKEGVIIKGDKVDLFSSMWKPK